MQDPTPQGTRIAHVGIALDSAFEASAFYREVLGLEAVEVSDSDGARISAFQAGEPLIELLEPAQPDTPIGRFIARRGPGIHHICFSVANLDAMLDRCRRAGVRLIDEEPRTGADGERIAFLHPSSTGGVLIELTER